MSTGVVPDLAHDAEGTAAATRAWWDAFDRPNCLIAIPAPTEGCVAIRQALAQGIDINVTLIFGLDQ